MGIVISHKENCCSALCSKVSCVFSFRWREFQQRGLEFRATFENSLSNSKMFLFYCISCFWIIPQLPTLLLNVLIYIPSTCFFLIQKMNFKHTPYCVWKTILPFYCTCKWHTFNIIRFYSGRCKEQLIHLQSIRIWTGITFRSTQYT
jgi:hypothetical protein